jgi:regulator of sigma E protease
LPLRYAILKKYEDRYVLGLPFHDLQVKYNPNPIQMVGHVFVEMKRTLGGMVTGSVSPKWLSGPVGIIHLTQMSWQKGASEAMYWMGLISLNLALLNLLPLPILDGGHISFACFEIVTRKRISAQLMQRIMIPFIVLFILFFIYVTYHDLLRLLN